MKQTGKRFCSLLLALALLAGLLSGIVPAAYAAMPSGGDAKVHAVSVTAITDGSAPWDDDDEAGNDNRADNGIVRSFDSVTYDFSVQIEPSDKTKSYTEAYVRMEFVLPLSKEQAEFDTAAMGWMESTGSYAYRITDQGNSQTLVGYKHLENAGKPIVPGSFGENLSIRVKGMSNGATIRPTIKASVAGNAEADQKTVAPDAVTVSAAPRYNIKIGGNAGYKESFDFTTGNREGTQIAPNLDITTGKVPGRIMNLAVCLELYNNSAEKGFKGVELPNGAPIRFKLQLGSEYRINIPLADSEYPQGTLVNAAEAGYMPLLYSADGNMLQAYGTANGDGRVLYDSNGAVVNHAPYNVGTGTNGCFNGGTWSAVQLKDEETGAPTNVVEVTVSDYQINIEQMPTMDADRSSHINEYGADRGIGVFSAGEFWFVQPFNQLGDETTDSTQYGIIRQFGEGAFYTSVQATDLTLTTVAGTLLQDSDGTNDRQQNRDDDVQEYGLELVLPGTLQNRVYYSDLKDTTTTGVNVPSQRYGDDVATPGTEFYLRSGFTYFANGEENNRLHWATNLLRFPADTFELTGEVKEDLLDGADGVEMTLYYAAKPDGTGWTSYDEMKNTTESGLVFYASAEELESSGKKCVGVLIFFDGLGALNGAKPQYGALIRARVHDDVVTNTTAAIVSTSRVWTQKMWLDGGSPELPDWTSTDNRIQIPNNYRGADGYQHALISGNAEGSTYYVPAVYDDANNLTPHNSDWGHWGDTMLFIGYKTAVTLNELQKVNGQEKETYALDKAQREADFVIRASASFDKNQGTPSKTTDLTISVTLPKYLTYLEGSAFYGGSYAQNSASGGVRGTVSGGTQLEPTVTEVLGDDGLPTGETLLVWTLTDVAVGQEVQPIYYSAFIGSKSPDSDCPQGTTVLASTVTISGTEDKRAFTVANRNTATQGITVIKGTANAFTKYVKADKTEADGTIDYVIYSSNNATAEQTFYLLDTMPADGHGGSSFAGSYHVSGWKLDASLCDAGKLAVYYTQDAKYVDATTQTVSQTEAQGWTKAALASDGSITDMNGKRPTAWAIIGSLESGKAINVELQIQLEPDYASFKDGTVYNNTISSGELSATAAATVVRRSISGMAWSDDDGDGLKNELPSSTDSRCAGTTFYTKENTNGDAILYLSTLKEAGVQTADLKRLKVVMSGSDNSVDPIKLYFRANNSQWAEGSRFEINNPTLKYGAGDRLSETEKEYVFDLSAAENANWTGELNEMRLDPVQGAGLHFNIKTITCVMSDGTERVMDFCTKDAYKNYVVLSSDVNPTPFFPTVEAVTLPEEAVLSGKRPGATYTSADDGMGDIYFTLDSAMFTGLSAKDLKAIRVVACGSPESDRNMKLYYAAGGQDLSESRTVELGKIDRNEAEYTFTLEGRADWTGAIDTIRLDPIQGPNLKVTLKTILLDLADGTTRTFDLTVPGTAEAYLRVGNAQGAPVYIDEAEDAVRDGVKVSLYQKAETGGTTFSTTDDTSVKNGNDAILYFNEVMYAGLTSDKVRDIRVVMSGDVTAIPPELFYKTSSHNTYTAQQKIQLAGQYPSTGMKEFVFDLSAESLFADGSQITGLRLDPLQGYGASFTVRSIAINLTDGSTRYFDFTKPDAYRTLVTQGNLNKTVRYAAVDPENAYIPATYPDATPVTGYLGQSISAKNKLAVQNCTPGSYEFRDLNGGTYLVRFESGSTDLSQFDKSTNAVSIYDAQGRLIAAELRGIELPATAEDFVSDGNNVGFYGKTVVVLNYDRKVAVDLCSYRDEAPTITVAERVDATEWTQKLEKTDANGKTITFAEAGADGKLHITPYDLIYSKGNPDASVFYKLTYPDGTSVIREVALKPADVIYYEESNESLLTFTDGQRGSWYKVTGDYRHEITGDASDYDTNADGQYQDADSHTDDYDSKYSDNEKNLYFSAGTARMVNVSTEIKNASLSAPYPSMKFSFYGTGFELVSMGTPYGGVINVQVYEGSLENGKKPLYTRTVNTRYGIYYGEQEDGESAPPAEGREVDRLYQGTALVKDDLAYGMYTVVCTPMYSPYFDPYEVGSFDILVDGVRILNPIGATPEYERTDFRDILTSGVSLFITEYGKTELSDKLEHGPKYEIHLAPQQSIAVSVTAKAGATLRMGAQSFNGAAGEFSVYSVQSFADSASKTPLCRQTLGIGTEMHYPVRTWDKDGTQILLFMNTGTTPIALTSFEYLPQSVTALSCKPEDTAAALPLANALLTPEDPSDEPTSDIGSLAVSAASLTLSGDISVNFYVPQENLEGVENPYLLCVKNLYDSDGNVVGTEEQKLTAYTENNGRRVYTFDGISAMEMGSLVTATVHGTKDGKDVAGKPLAYSVKTYAANQLRRDTTPKKLKTLLVDMLNYGAAAQDYWSYNTAEPVNGNLTDELKALATQTQPTLTDGCTVTDNTGRIRFDSVSLLLRETVAIKYYLSPNGYTGKMSDLTMKITYIDQNGETQTASVTGDRFTVSGERYAAVFDTLNPTQLRTLCTAEIFDADGNRISGTLTYSAESYAARKQSDSDEKLVALLNEMMKYGDSTAAYYGASAQQVRKARQAYELCYARIMDQAQDPDGITSGWEVDNRAGLGKTSNTGNGQISDVKTDEHSRLLRYFNNETEGRFDFRFRLSYIAGFEGNVMRLTAEDGTDTYYLVTKADGFYLKAKDGSLTQLAASKEAVGDLNNLLIHVIIDLDKGISKTEISGVDCGTHPLLGTQFRRLSFETTDESINSTTLLGGYVEANYAVFEDFNVPTQSVPTSFTNPSALSVTNEALLLSKGGKTECSFEPIGSRVCFTLSLLPDNGIKSSSVNLCAGDDVLVKLELRDDNALYANGQKIMKTNAGGVLNEAEQERLTNNMWHLLRIEADMATHKAVIKVHTKQVATVDFLINAEYVDRICFDNTDGNGAIRFDDIMVYNLVDYDVPAPVIPEGADDYNIGINVCSLWENGKHLGWGTISPHDDLTPVLGYYDENLTETADWEIKYMAEHGIDFQAFCWFASSGYSQLTPSARHLDRAFVNAKYSDKMKFCLLWEAANGSIPASESDFYNYYVPYMIENYFTNPSYMTIDNKPVLAIFGAYRIKNQFKEKTAVMFDYLRAEARKVGFDGVIILDCNGGETQIEKYGFDGWYAYNWGKNYTFSQDKTNNENKQNAVDAYVVPTISVGFNNVGWAQTRSPLMSTDDFKLSNEWVKNTYLPSNANASKTAEDHWQENLVMISTWNEYGEGTYIMPSENLNGFGYLDVLRAVYTKGGSHTDVVPTEKQKTLINHNYPQDRRRLRQNGDYTGPQAKSEKTVTADFYGTASQITVNADGSFLSTGTDPVLNLKNTLYQDLRVDQVLRIRVKAEGIPKGDWMQLFFETDETGGISEANSIRVYSASDGEQEFVFQLSVHSGWKGSIIKQLRLDPLTKSGVTFRIKAITFELTGDYSEIYINGMKLNSKIAVETKNGTDYLPFEPGVSLIHHLLSLYYEWSYETKTLTLYRNKHTYCFVVGKDYVLIDGTTRVALGGTVYQQDNIPMLPIAGTLKAMGLHYVTDGLDYRISTQEGTLFDVEPEGVWTFNRPGDSRGWTLAGGDLSFGTDFMKITSTPTSNGGTYDPRLSLTGLNLDCAKYQTLQVCVKWSRSGTSNDGMKFYFTTTDHPGLNEASTVSQNIAVSSDGQYQVLTFQMSGNSNWTGRLTQLRFDPFNSAGTAEIQSIRFVEAEESTTLLEDDAEDGVKFSVSPGYSIEAVTDPTAQFNTCYYVHTTNMTWLYARRAAVFAPGTTYRIEFDVMIDPNGAVESSQIVCNMQYKDPSRSDVNHVLTQLRVSKSDGWVHYSTLCTVPANCTDRTADLFSIYSNPQNGSTTNYYFDNVKVTAVSGSNARSVEKADGVTIAAARPQNLSRTAF